MSTTVFRIVTGLPAALALLEELAKLSTPFRFESLPDDRYEVAHKREIAP